MQFVCLPIPFIREFYDFFDYEILDICYKTVIYLACVFTLWKYFMQYIELGKYERIIYTFILSAILLFVFYYVVFHINAFILYLTNPDGFFAFLE